MMRISVYAQKKIILTCKYIFLEPFASELNRKFIFQGIRSRSKSKATLIIENNEVIDDLTISVFIKNKLGNKRIVYQFNVLIKDYGELQNSMWSIYGLASGEYRQGVIDILNLWEHKRNLEWCFAKPEQKQDYLLCCFYYTGLSKTMLERESYKFDLSLINDETDFLYFAGLEFVGEKGYFGWDLYSFKDCLLELHSNGAFAIKKLIEFYNIDRVSDINLYRDIKDSLKSFNVNIKEIIGQ